MKTKTTRAAVNKQKTASRNRAVLARREEPVCQLCAWMLEEDHEHLKNPALPFCRKCTAFRRNPNSSSKICYHCFMRDGSGCVYDCPFCAKPN